MPDTVKYLLDESRLPKDWYNIVADLPRPPDPVLHPVAERKDRPATYLAHDKPRQGLEFPDAQRNGSSTGAIEEIAREEGKQQDRQEFTDPPGWSRVTRHRVWERHDSPPPQHGEHRGSEHQADDHQRQGEQANRIEECTSCSQ